MDLDKIGSVMGVTKMVSSKPEKSKNSGWGMIIAGIIFMMVGLALIFAPESMIKIDGDRIVLFVPLIFGVVFTIAGVASVVMSKKKQQMLATMKNSGVRIKDILLAFIEPGFRRAIATTI